jgi:hypothetical protein
VFNRALINLMPLLKVKQLKQKRKRLQLKEFPYIINVKSRISIALKFFLNRKKSKKDTKTSQRFVGELVAVANKSGISISKKKSLYEYIFIKKKYFWDIFLFLPPFLGLLKKLYKKQLNFRIIPMASFIY